MAKKKHNQKDNLAALKQQASAKAALWEKLKDNAVTEQKIVENLVIEKHISDIAVQANHVSVAMKGMNQSVNNYINQLYQAYSGMGMSYSMGGYANAPGPSLVQKHRDEFKQQVKHPITGNPTSIDTIIISLNDHFYWSREKIADWLDTLDNQPVFFPNTCPDDCTCTECKPKPKAPDPILYSEATPSQGVAYNNKLYPYNDVSITFSKEPGEVDTIYGESSSFPFYIQKSPPTYTGKISISDEKWHKLTDYQLKAIEDIINAGPVFSETDFLTHTKTLIIKGDPELVAIKINKVKDVIQNVPAQSNGCSVCHHPGGPNIHWSGCSASEPFDL